MRSHLDELADTLDANTTVEVFDYSIVKEDLDDLLPAVNNTIASAEPELSTYEKALPMIMDLQIVVNTVAWSAIHTLCLARTDSAEAPDYIFTTPPLTRTLLDSLLNTIFMFDNPEENVHWFLVSGWREQVKTFNRYKTKYGKNAAWATWLEFARRDIDQTEKFFVALSPEEKQGKATTRFWPNPGKMGAIHKDPARSFPMRDAGRTQFVRYMKDWHYGRLSGESHLNLQGLLNRGALHLPRAGNADAESFAARTRFMYLTSAFSIYLALITEVALEVSFPKDRLLPIWRKTAAAWSDVGELYTERYQALLR